jgi:RNA polymerase sigma-70 factor, ECF subfamily
MRTASPGAGWSAGVSAVPPSESEADPPCDERELVERAKKGDQAALAQLFDGNYTRVFSYLRVRLGSEQDAEDLAQEAFLRMHTALPRYEQRGVPFRSWLLQIAANLVNDFYRKRGTSPRTSSLNDAFVEAEGEPDPALAVEIQFSLDEVGAAMVHLTELEREVVRLRYAAELSITETARHLGKTENNIKQLTHKALIKLRGILGERNAGNR